MNNILNKFDNNNNNDDNGYYGSSDYSDNNSIKKSLTSSSNVDKLYGISSPTSSSSSSTETTQTSTTPSSTASSSPSLKQQVLPTKAVLDNFVKTIPNTKADVKIYFERFERIYNAVTQDESKENTRRNSLTTCSYV